ncbi:MAG: STAS domain-containing protein [Planctomycetes bacterium]|nr:STAS domain-containing protein [Planctomycetota bacterium]
MSELKHIEVYQAQSGADRVTVVEFRDDRLWEATVLQQLSQELSSLLESGERQHFLLNLARVDYMSSAALNRLINFQKRVHATGGKLKLCNLKPAIDEVFAATRFNQVLDIHATPAEALSSY